MEQDLRQRLSALNPKYRRLFLERFVLNVTIESRGVIHHIDLDSDTKVQYLACLNELIHRSINWLADESCGLDDFLDTVEANVEPCPGLRPAIMRTVMDSLRSSEARDV